VGTRKIRSIHFRKNAQRLNVVGVNRHTIDNGMDFVRIGKLIGSLFKKEKDSDQIQKSP
jgi:hypothetical protein